MKILFWSLACSALPILTLGKECTFCFNDEEVDNLGAATPRMSSITKSCLDLKTEWTYRKDTLSKAGNERKCIEFQLEGYQTGCCIQVDPDGCGICPDGSPPGQGYVVPTEGSGDPNPEDCEGYNFQPNSNNGIFKVGTCADTRAQRSAFYCGCPGQYQQVWLCPNKRPPGRRRRGDFTRSENCGQTEYLFSLFKEYEVTDINRDWGFNYQAWCECNDEDGNKVALENDYYCPFCPDGQSIKEGFHDYVFNEETALVDINGKYDYRRTCRQAAEFTRYVTKDFMCRNEHIEIARQACCPAPGLGVTMGLVLTGLVMIRNLSF